MYGHSSPHSPSWFTRAAADLRNPYPRALLARTSGVMIRREPDPQSSSRHGDRRRPAAQSRLLLGDPRPPAREADRQLRRSRHLSLLLWRRRRDAGQHHDVLSLAARPRRAAWNWAGGGDII